MEHGACQWSSNGCGSASGCLHDDDAAVQTQPETKMQNEKAWRLLEESGVQKEIGVYVICLEPLGARLVEHLKRYEGAIGRPTACWRLRAKTGTDLSQNGYGQFFFLFFEKP